MEFIAFSEGDVVAISGDNDEWLVEQFHPDSPDTDVTIYNLRTGDYIAQNYKDMRRRIVRVIRHQE
ncbi:TPA: hypothetical protein JAX37_002493 [Enterobacter cloacae]|nr:hypothetical protein [Enterobacter cloacae]